MFVPFFCSPGTRGEAQETEGHSCPAWQPWLLGGGQDQKGRAWGPPMIAANLFHHRNLASTGRWCSGAQGSQQKLVSAGTCSRKCWQVDTGDLLGWRLGVCPDSGVGLALGPGDGACAHLPRFPVYPMLSSVREAGLWSLLSFWTPPPPQLSLPRCQEGASAGTGSRLNLALPGSLKVPFCGALQRSSGAAAGGWGRDCSRPGMGRWFDFSPALFVVVLEHRHSGRAGRGSPLRTGAGVSQGRGSSQYRVWKDS